MQATETPHGRPRTAALLVLALLTGGPAAALTQPGPTEIVGFNDPGPTLWPHVIVARHNAALDPGRLARTPLARTQDIGPAYVALATCARFDCRDAFAHPGLRLGYYGTYIGDEPISADYGDGALKAVALDLGSAKVTADGQAFTFEGDEIRAVVFGPFAAAGTRAPSLAEATLGPGLEALCASRRFETSILLENEGEWVWAQATTELRLPGAELGARPYGDLCPRGALRPVTDAGTETHTFAGKTNTRRVLHLHEQAVIGIARTAPAARALLDRVRALAPGH